MSTDHHTPITVGAAANAATFNAPLGQLDAAISVGAGLATTGATTGATAQAQPFTVGVSLADTTTSTSGVIFKAADRFIHNFHHPTGDTAVPAGNNTFVGVDAGNFTMGSTATETYHGSYNTAVGVYSLSANTTGANNTATGYASLSVNTTGENNAATGYASLYANTTGGANTAVGAYSLYANTTGANNAAVGVSSLYANTTGANNTAVGSNAGRYHADGATALETPENSIYIGAGARGYDNDDSNSIVIGYGAIGLGANTTVLGNTSTTLTALPGGALQMTEMSAPTGTANKATIYAVDNGAGKTQLMVIFGSGVAIQLAIEP